MCVYVRKVCCRPDLTLQPAAGLPSNVHITASNANVLVSKQAQTFSLPGFYSDDVIDGEKKNKTNELSLAVLLQNEQISLPFSE